MSESDLRERIATLEDEAQAAIRSEHVAWRLLWGLTVVLVLVGGAAWAFFGHEKGVGPAAFAIGFFFLLFGPQEHDHERQEHA